MSSTAVSPYLSCIVELSAISTHTCPDGDFMLMPDAADVTHALRHIKATIAFLIPWYSLFKVLKQHMKANTLALLSKIKKKSACQHLIFVIIKHTTDICQAK